MIKDLKQAKLLARESSIGSGRKSQKVAEKIMTDCILRLRRNRVPVILRYIKFISFDRIAEIMDLPAGCVKNQAYRGRKKVIKEFLQKTTENQ